MHLTILNAGITTTIFNMYYRIITYNVKREISYTIEHKTSVSHTYLKWLFFFKTPKLICTLIAAYKLTKHLFLITIYLNFKTLSSSKLRAI